MADGDHKGELEDSPAIIALGSLLKLTEIHFWYDLVFYLKNLMDVKRVFLISYFQYMVET